MLSSPSLLYDLDDSELVVFVEEEDEDDDLDELPRFVSESLEDDFCFLPIFSCLLSSDECSGEEESLLEEFLLFVLLEKVGEDGGEEDSSSVV